MQVCPLREFAVHRRILGMIWLVKVPAFHHVRAAKPRLDREGCIRSNQNCECTTSTRWTSGVSFVDCNVSANNQREAAVPVAALDPSNGVEQRSRAAVASVRAGYAL